jgi:hypothetical protein
MVTSLEKRMPKDIHAFTQARQYTNSSEQLSAVTTALVEKYTINSKTVADAKKAKVMGNLSRALDRRGLDKRLHEIVHNLVTLT